MTATRAELANQKPLRGSCQAEYARRSLGAGWGPVKRDVQESRQARQGSLRQACARSGFGHSARSGFGHSQDLLTCSSTLARFESDGITVVQ